MPTALTEQLPIAPPTAPPRKKWTRAECEQLQAAGLLEHEHLELVEGELINKMGKNRPHVDALMLLLGWLVGIFGLRFVNPEAPIDVSPEDNPTSEPQPDLIVLKASFTQFRTARPQPSDLVLVVEIADTTLAYDLAVKARLYARAAIPEYWVLDVNDRRLYAHRQPAAGVYTSVIIFGAEEGIAPLAAPDAMLRVADLFPE